MKKARLILLLLTLFGSGILSAREIPVDQARQKASQFWQSAPATRGASPSWQLVLDSENSATRSSTATPAYYVFDNASGPGFVIVAGDDVAMPVLGYSFENEFPAGNLPPNLKTWLDDVRETIIRARNDALHAESDVVKAWSSTRVGTPVVQLETAQWDQGTPYNELCPLYQGTRTYTGCTATALAIAMRYHKWPEAGVGTLPAYTSPSYGIQVPETTLGHRYDWDNMPLSYDSQYAQEQARAVATLMRDCSFLLQSDFGPEGSSGTSAYITDIPIRLITYMGYDKQIHFAYRTSHSTAEWNRIMKGELDDNRPIIYSGYNPQAGHAFILDGYTDDNYYSVNWGWSGYYNGYFLLTALDPAGQGAGGSDHYNDDQIAIVGMQKDAGGADYEELRFAKYTDLANNIVYNGIAVNGTFATGEYIEGSAGLISNDSNITLSGECQVAITNRDGEIVRTILQDSFSDIPPRYGFLITFQYTIDIPLLPGYRIRVLYRTPNNPEWRVVAGNDDDNCVWDLPVADEYSIEESTRLEYNRTDRMMRLQVKEGVSATLLGDDGSDYSRLCHAENAQEIRIDTSELAAGSYRLILQKGSERKELRLSFSARE